MEFLEKMKYRHKKGIYCIECVPTKEKYIGKTGDRFLNRYNNHIESFKKGIQNQKMQACWNKYGADNFVFFVIEECENEDELNKLERHYIQKYDTCKSGFNVKRGGDGGPLSEKTKEKMRMSSKHRKLTPEAIKRMSLAKKNAFNEESRRKMRLAKLHGVHPRAVLNDNLVVKIKESLMKGNTIQSVANEFGISYHNVRTVYKNTCWEYVHVPGYDEWVKSRYNKAKPLKREQVLEIKDYLNKGYTASQISKITGHTPSVVYGIKQGRTYTDIV